MSKTKKTVKRSIVPVGDKVLVLESKARQRTDTGFILPESADQGGGLKEGVVLAVGDGKYVDDELVELFVKKGDVVLFAWGDRIELDGEEYFLVKESEISARIESK